uniref:SAC domain-containing protein n=1 Tax=Chenopodium quinoa TaxID=63459 RepID=A0A803KQX3_CHEQI
MVGSDKSKRFWRILKIDRLASSNLVVFEDPTVYSAHECSVILKRIDEGNKHAGGLKIVTTCYGIVGFVKFLGPYYMILITERRKVGKICGHAIYAVSKRKMIQIPHSPARFDSINSKNEKRYKKLLGTVDITKDFFFSYSYRIMHSLQKNLCDEQKKILPYETMFVWNAYLTREIRTLLGNSVWTVALIHGFFKQVKFQRSDRTVNLTLIARRSRHYAGTRFLKRGVNEKGRAANDVETEQIVYEEIPSTCMPEISSVVQIRGSIPLLWSQETSRMTLRPDIILSKEDPYYEATRRHFQNLVDRYGNPIFILNLIKTKEKKPRESVLHSEFVKAVASINKTLDKDTRLKFRTVDLTRLYSMKNIDRKYVHFSKGDKVLMLLSRVAENALDQTGFFYCQVPSLMNSELSSGFSDATTEHVNSTDITEYSASKTTRFQSGVLRTNCIDCLDRTNAAQYAYGLIALGHQLHAIGINPTPIIDPDDTLAKMLMGLYEAMGDTIALQYGGSAAHNKIFSDRKGHWKAAIQSQEFIRTLQRYLNNAYMDPEKQDAINLFLGHFQPEVGKPALWELDSDQHYSIGRLTSSLTDDISGSFLKRSMSDGVLMYESPSPTTPAEASNYHHTLPDLKEDKSGLSDSTPEMPTCDVSDANVSYTRFTPSMSARRLFTDMPETKYMRGECSCYIEHGSEFDCSDILDIDWISSSGNSCEEDSYDISSLVNSPVGGSLHGSSVNNASQGRLRDAPKAADFPDSFKHWVEFGSILA